MAPVYKLSASSVTGRTNYGSMLAGNPAYDPNAYVALDTYSLGSDQNSITFSNINQNYVHLEIRASLKVGSGTSLYDLGWRANTVSTNSYSWHKMYSSSGIAGATGTSTDTSGWFGAVNGNHLAGAMSALRFTLLDYSNTNKKSTSMSISGGTQAGSGTNYLQWGGGTWQSNSAITSITIYVRNGTNIEAGSKFNLYGIKGA